MGIYLLKFSACLFVLWLLYVCFLEREKMHHFKRFYLISSIIASISIPLFSITYYVDPKPTDNPIASNQIYLESGNVTDKIPAIEFLDVLWIMYSIGVLIFAFRFLKNLKQIQLRIRHNDHLKQNPFTYILLKQDVNPHTFFNYIFFNKYTFENNALPKAVILHEETHAKQKHSLDILFIEIVRIVFWFHPLIILLKRHIKLNHEFLADEAVINRGVKPSQYQNILLAFSSNASEYQLANAFNYLSIKKRFTVMKTTTSRVKIWLCSFLLLPVMALLFFSFSNKVIIEKTSTDTESTNSLFSVERISSKFDNYRKLSKTYTELISVYVKTGKVDVSKLKALKAKTDKIYASFTKAEITKHNLRPTPPLPAIKNNWQEKATAKQVAEYNTLAKKCGQKSKDGKHYVKLKDLRRLKYIYSIMTDEQKKSALPYPDCPPPPKPQLIEVIEVAPPKPPKAPKVVEVKEVKSKKSPKPPKKAKLVEVIEVAPPKPPKAPKVIEVKEVKPPEPPKPVLIEVVEVPPPPKSPKAFIKEMAKKNAIFYLNGKKISSDKALEIERTAKKVNVNHKVVKGKDHLYLTTKPMVKELKVKKPQ